MFTEDEASTKWCPFARVGFSGAAGNRYSMDIDKSKASAFAVCIGSSCMAWRQATNDIEWAVASPGPDWEEDVKEGHYRLTLKTDEGVKLRWRRKVPLGYCGLAGHP